MFSKSELNLFIKSQYFKQKNWYEISLGCGKKFIAIVEFFCVLDIA